MGKPLRKPKQQRNYRRLPRTVNRIRLVVARLAFLFLFGSIQTFYTKYRAKEPAEARTRMRGVPLLGALRYMNLVRQLLAEVVPVFNS